MAEEPIITPEYDPNFDTATFYGCRGLNNKNSFTYEIGSNSCRLFGRTQLPLSFSSNTGFCKDVSLQNVPGNHACFSNFNLSLIQSFDNSRKYCFSTGPQNNEGLKVCREFTTIEQGVKTSVHCLMHDSSTVNLYVNKVCREYGITLQTNYFIPTKQCREYYDFDKTGYHTCFTFIPYSKVLNFNRKQISCGSGKFLIFDNLKTCLNIGTTPIQEHFNIRIDGCKVVTDNRIYTGNRPCILPHFNSIIQSFYKNTTCLKLSFNPTKGQRLCNKKFSSDVVVSVVFGRVNGGRPQTNTFSRSSGRMIGRITQ